MFSDELPAPLPLIQKKYSLGPDMIFGWRPKQMKSSPIPLDFSLNPLPSCKDFQEQKLPIIYFGYRPQNSHIMHKFFSKKSTYNYLVKSHVATEVEYNYKQVLIKPCRRIHGMKAEYLNEIEFDSFFECGNLDKVVKTSRNDYDLYMRSDTNTYGNYKWFYFRVQNNCEDRLIKFSIINFKEQHSLFTQGQKPKIKFEDKDWEDLEGPVTYKLSKLNKFVRKGTYYQLSFDLHLKAKQACYIATTIPYTLTELHDFLDSLPNEVLVTTLGKSLSGISIPLLTLTKSSPDQNTKKFIIIQARQHPSETVGSTLIHNCIRFLTGGSKIANKLLEKYTFKIIPMVNVDGVVVGNSRMSFAGDDLNRKFAEPDPLLHPEILAVKRLVHECNRHSNVFMFIDLHGHSKKKGSFMYGPYFPMHSDTYYNIRLLPKYLSEMSEIFRYYSCRFKSEKALRQSARLVMSQNLNIKYTYTMENSLYGYVNHNRTSVAFRKSDFKDLARYLIKSIYKFSKYIEAESRRKDNRRAKHENSIKEFEEEECKSNDSSDSDSQSESEEECVEAKKVVVMAIKRYKNKSSRKVRSNQPVNNGKKESKRIKSQNHFTNISKNLPDLAKKQMITSKIVTSHKFMSKESISSAVNISSRVVSLNETLTKNETSEISPNNSIEKLSLINPKPSYSKINLFDMFTSRKSPAFADDSQGRFRKNFNFPAYFKRSYKNP